MKKFLSVLLVIAAISGTSLGAVKVKLPGIDISVDEDSTSTKIGSVGVSTGTSGSVKKTKKDIVIQGVDLDRTISANGGNVVIKGTDNDITIRGQVSTLTIEGVDNEVYLDSVRNIRIIGADNKVVYKTSSNKSGRASISIKGEDNSVSKSK